MDRQAIRFIDMLEDDKIELATKMKVFEMGQNWLSRRQKLKPKNDDAEGAGVTDMRSWIESASGREMIDKMMFEAGYVKAPPSRPGRPRKDEQPVHDRHRAYKEATRAVQQASDDSNWQKLLTGDEDEGEEGEAA